MKKFIILLILTICIISNFVTYYFVSEHYRNVYQLYNISRQRFMTIENMDAWVDKNTFSMFRPTCTLNLKIKGVISLSSSKNGKCIDRLHISERIEIIDGEEVAIIKVTPIVSTDVFEQMKDDDKRFEYTYKHTLHPYKSYGTNKYIIECGDFSKVIEIEGKK